MSWCEVPGCPAARVGRRFCAVHEDARTATALGIAGVAGVKGAASCARCRKKFKHDDYVQRQPVKLKNGFGWQHATCPPVRPRKAESSESLPWE